MKSFETFLEENGWRRSTAGNEDFDAVLKAMELMRTTRKGILIGGAYGCGKTSLAKVICKMLAGVFEVHLGIPDATEKLTHRWQTMFAVNPFEQNVLLDDIGAEKAVNEYGIITEHVADFIVSYHAYAGEGVRLVCTTNLNVGQLDERYGGRMVSRLKDLCIPLRLNGKDKRKWAI